MGEIKYLVRMENGREYTVWAYNRFGAGKKAMKIAKKNGEKTDVEFVDKYRNVYETIVDRMNITPRLRRLK